jgi:hypothetical protein
VKFNNVPVPIKESELLLRQKHPNYTETKVEERLLEKDKIRKYKLEETRERNYEATSPKPFVPTNTNQNMYTPKNVEYKNRTLSE